MKAGVDVPEFSYDLPVRSVTPPNESRRSAPVRRTGYHVVRPLQQERDLAEQKPFAENIECGKQRKIEAPPSNDHVQKRIRVSKTRTRFVLFRKVLEKTL